MRKSVIAIVGIGGRFPDSDSLDRFWANIVDSVDCTGDVPLGRWLIDPSQAFDPRIALVDHVHSIEGGFVATPQVDGSGLDLDGALIDRLDPLFRLTIHVACQAWRDARTDQVDRQRVGVVFGNIVLPTETASSWSREILGPVFEERLGVSPDDKLEIEPLNAFPAGLPAALVASALGLRGNAYTLDAACASSLYALKLAIDELRSGRADAMLSGGVSRPDPLYTQMGFAQLRALSTLGRPAPFDRHADGLVVGEGAGMFVLKRLEDAIQHGDHIYGVVTGIGLSNDIHGDLLAPSSEGQLRAMRMAYEQAGWTPGDVDLIECHATGTPIGDAVEVDSLKSLWQGIDCQPGQCVIGSVKSNIGHTLTAAGSAGLLKVLLALEHRRLPPTANFEQSGPNLGLEDSPFRVLSQAEEWADPDSGRPRRAAVSGFGFGGINAHVLIEEWVPGRNHQPERFLPAKSPVPSTADTHTPDAVHSSPIAIVGLSAHFGPFAGKQAFQERVLGADQVDRPTGPPNWWGATETDWFRRQGWDEGSFPGFYLQSLDIQVGQFRIPPKELAEMLPQQSLMLKVAADAIRDAGWDPGMAVRTGVLIGIGLDLNSTNFQLRWSLADRARAWSSQLGLDLSPRDLSRWIDELRQASGPPLTANRTMGSLGGLIASRIAREFRIGGPSFTVSSDETSGIQAMAIAADWLRRGELDAAVVGAVDFAGDIRSVLARHRLGIGLEQSTDRNLAPIVCDGAISLVLKRLDDAERNKDFIYATIRGIGSASMRGQGHANVSADLATRDIAAECAFTQADPLAAPIGLLEVQTPWLPERLDFESETQRLALYDPASGRQVGRDVRSNQLEIGHAGAASGLAAVARTAINLTHQILPPPQPAIQSRAESNTTPSAGSQFWLRNRSEGPRRAAVSATSQGGNYQYVILEEPPETATRRLSSDVESKHPLGPPAVAVFAIEADDESGLIERIEELDRLARNSSTATVEILARHWWRRYPNDPRLARGLSVVTSTVNSIPGLLESATRLLSGDETRIDRDGARHRTGMVHYRRRETADSSPGRLAFVYPGLGSYFQGMGRDLSARWPEVLRAQDIQTGNLREQLDPGVWWNAELPRSFADHRIPILGQVAVGSLVTDLLRGLDVTPDAAIGYSLGESVALVALGAWPNRDEMYHRLWSSPLFHTELSGPCHTARRLWNIPPGEPVDWFAGIVSCSPQTVRGAIGAKSRVYLLITNTARESIIGGFRDEVAEVVKSLGCTFTELPTVSTVHCPIGHAVEADYRALHDLETQAPAGITFYSGVWGRSYTVDRQSAAEAITAQAAGHIDFPALVERAYRDGVRTFLEIGPGNSCTRLIPEILGRRPHLACSACRPDRDPLAVILDVIAQLIAHRVPVDLSSLYGPIASHDDVAIGSTTRSTETAWRTLRIVVRGRAFSIPALPSHPVPVANSIDSPLHQQTTLQPPTDTSVPGGPAIVQRHVAKRTIPDRKAAPVRFIGRDRSSDLSPLTRSLADTERATAEAHAAFLRVTHDAMDLIGKQLALQLELIEHGSYDTKSATDRPDARPEIEPFHRSEERRSAPGELPRSKCLEFAVGSIAAVLGPDFAEVDHFPTRVRLPDEPLMLVDRVVTIEGPPRSLGSGRVVTEHNIHDGAWYLDGGRIATCIAIEAGQADLLLSAYLGVDFETRGLAVYRLLDATVTYHRALPGPGEVILFDIQITGFFRQGKTILFRFQFDATVDGVPLLSMRDGCAGFFTAEELAAGRGIVPRSLETRSRQLSSEIAPDHLVPMTSSRLDARQMQALREGDPATAFGPSFHRYPIDGPLTLPGGRMVLVHRVICLEPTGGFYKLGLIRAETDIHADDWFMVCHFVDDRVMPGTLMYECCLHTLRIFLLRMGWVGRVGQVAFEPVPGIPNRLKCRGQITETTRVVTYEVTIKEIGYRPEPYAIADALIYGDGKPIVEFTNMAIQLSGTDRRELEAIWAGRDIGTDPSPDSSAFPRTVEQTAGTASPAYTYEQVHAFAVGKPSVAFGDRYRVFDEERFISRLPGPPYQFLDRIMRVEGSPWILNVGSLTEAQYDIPPDAWYFDADRQDHVPFAVLLEVALQPCGWLAAYMGSALTSDDDLKFRNLGGSARQYRPVTRQTGTLTTTIKVTKITNTAGMILQHFDLETSSSEGPVYTGTTEFGFFPTRMLLEQVGIRNADTYVISAEELARAQRFPSPTEAPFPDSRWSMIDQVDALILDGGPHGLGVARGSARVDPDAWFFKAHFLHDPVWPGSLGLESMLQLLKILVASRWAVDPGSVFEAPGLEQTHQWTYRGQIIPANQRVTVQVEIKACDQERRQLVADGHLDVDGKTIYQMKDFSVRLADGDSPFGRGRSTHSSSLRPLVGL